MSDYERLDEIHLLLDEYQESEDPFEQTEIAIKLLHGHIGFLIKRTEEFQKINKQNKRYRELLNGIKQAHAYGSGCIESFIHEFEQEEDDEEYKIEVSV